MDDVVGWIHDLTYRDLPSTVVEQARRRLLDLLGVAAAGIGTDLSAIARRHALRTMAAAEGPRARILFDGRLVSPQGAAFAGAATLDSFDAHDGHRLTKGHVGVAVLPALLAYREAGSPVTEREFITCLALGYEIGTRAGLALHASARDYHTSGAWNALGCAAIGARLMGLDGERTRHALGIAEYHGPRSQMMRCIDHPTMVKDGSAFGALAGVSAAYLAADGFTGAPALTVEDKSQASTWADLGRRWRILEQYFKPYPICRWAQPAVEAALDLLHAQSLVSADIEQIRIHTFEEATRLATPAPETTEQAQYSLPFPVAAALVHGKLGGDQIGGSGLGDTETLKLAQRIELVVDPDIDRRFPAERLARVDFQVRGKWITGVPHPARGDPEQPLSQEELTGKFRDLATPILGEACSAMVEAAVSTLTEDPDALDALLNAIMVAPEGRKAYAMQHETR